ncbi:MAG: hypothetical protein GX299_07740 [Epulopiscium sp.]|jgi:hypothetical protein|nr:hypothetical protein [Candidatus Epulonipiscium sp.]
MTEESKELLSAMKDMFDVLSGKMDTIDSRLTQEIKELKMEVKEIKMTLENETNKNIQLLVEGHMQNADKLQQLDAIKDDVEYLKLKTDVVEGVTKLHSYDINHLKKVK